jgi:CheY-like chemotaxis protein
VVARILVVDDDPSVLNLEAIRLRRLGYNATLFSNPREALAAATAEPGVFDLLVTDYHMPDMTGLELVDRLRAEDQCPCPPVILMSGYRSEFTEAELRRAGVEAVLEKPVETDKLAAAVEQLL